MGESFMPSNAEVVDQLGAAVKSKALVVIERTPRNADNLMGFVLAVGGKWVLLSEIGDGGYLDEGLVAVRCRDINEVRPQTSFEARFAQSQPGWPPSAPAAIDLNTTSSMIRDMSRLAPVVGIEQERRFHSGMVDRDRHRGRQRLALATRSSAGWSLAEESVGLPEPPNHQGDCP
ncbi:hypothetical protein [Angustibacter peucedani]